MEPSASDAYRLHAFVTGRVQGVGFRYFVLENAVALDLTGWVRNTPDGQVEVLAEGPHAVLQQLLALLQRGPRAAFVSEVRPDWSPASGEFAQFTVRSTSYR